MAVLPLDRPRPLPLRCDDLKPKPLFVPDRRQAHAERASGRSPRGRPIR